MPTKHITKCGWLVKKKNSINAFSQQRRWFMLVGDTLYYYKSQQDAQPRGALSLGGATVRLVSTSDLCLELVLSVAVATKVKPRLVSAHGFSQAYFLFAPSVIQLDEWLAALADASVGNSLHPRLSSSG